VFVTLGTWAHGFLGPAVGPLIVWPLGSCEIGLLSTFSLGLLGTWDMSYWAIGHLGRRAVGPFDSRGFALLGS
jgi:hypothetical protein